MSDKINSVTRASCWDLYTRKFEIIIFVSRFLYSHSSLRLRQVHSCRLFPDVVSNSIFIASDDDRE